MAINSVPVSVLDHAGILTKFPEKYRDKLKLYTGEELFYVYKIMTYKATMKNGGYNSSDILYLSLKAKMTRYLKGNEKYGIHANALPKLGMKFQSQFHGYIEAEITE